MASSRSLTASESGIAAIQNRLTTKKWGHEDLAGAAEMSRATAIGFCTGKKVDRKNFVTCCEKLGLDWEVISGQKTVSIPAAEPTSDIDSLVRQLRESSAESLRKRCGTMRILDMTQPIDSGAIYTDVNILERVAGKTRREIQEMMADCGAEGFDRFFLGNVKQQRVPGLDAVLDKRQLMILGRPGAGKTTFLKRLAIECLNGKFLADRLPIFVTLKEFAETEGKPGIVEFMARLVNLQPDSAVKNKFKPRPGDVGFGRSPLHIALRSGRGLVLLDGLDEVMEKDHDRVIREIREFAEQYSQNHIVITCRIAAREYIFQQFTEVEMADFDDNQIQSFADKWFKTKENDPESTTGAMFWQELESRKPVKELAANPLLLTLLCLEFDNSSAFPQSRSELYDRALNVLLSKWDGQRRIQRGEEVYKGLSLKRKETLLGQLAMYTFDRGDYFFKEKVATQQIEQYIRNLPGAKEDPAALEVDSRAVLKSIESRHGLLSERATGIYSFSHLTFQEYFTAKNILDLSNPAAQEKNLDQLVKHIGEERWKEVFLLVVEGLDNADYLLRLMKERIDSMLIDETEIQLMLSWAQQKSSLVKGSFKKTAVRAYYYAFFMRNDTRLAFEIDECLAKATRVNDGKYLEEEFKKDVENMNFDGITVKSVLEIPSLNNLLACLCRDSQKFSHNDFMLDSGLNRLLYITPETLNKAFKGFEFEKSAFPDFLLGLAFAFAVEVIRCFVEDPHLERQIKRLRNLLPNISNEAGDIFSGWWIEKKPYWTEDLRQIMIKYRNIGHDWQFTDEQKAKLQEYYDANLLLTECLNSECYLSREVREEIEATMLLPMAVIEQWKEERRRKTEEN
jgi:predicted NACHT family NTPase